MPLLLALEAGLHVSTKGRLFDDAGRDAAHEQHRPAYAVVG
ncbi:MAG: hypothetical protein R2712_24795 [Vicinamibacterales bacterium]